MTGCGENGYGLNLEGDFAFAMSKYIGQTVTIFTQSGGTSGCGFTGVVIGVNECFVRLITQIGPAPGCALGNACGGSNMSNGIGCGNEMMMGAPIATVGSVTDIPLSSIVSFVHPAV